MTKIFGILSLVKYSLTGDTTMLSIELIAVAVCGGLSLLALYIFHKAEEVLEEATQEVCNMQRLLESNKRLLKTIEEKQNGRPQPQAEEF